MLACDVFECDVLESDVLHVMCKVMIATTQDSSLEIKISIGLRPT